MDLDEVVEGVAGKSVGEIFAVEGEVAFRDLELLSLNNILSKEPISKTSFQPTSNTAVGTAAEETEMVLALGGGTVMNSECAEMVKENTLCIYLRASVSTLVERLASETESRPLLCQNTSSSMPAEGAKLSDHQLRNRIEVLLAQRAATYENTASIIIDTDGKSIDQICTEILKLSPTN
jgi:shikimate kinase